MEANKNHKYSSVSSEKGFILHSNLIDKIGRKSFFGRKYYISYKNPEKPSVKKKTLFDSFANKLGFKKIKDKKPDDLEIFLNKRDIYFIKKSEDVDSLVKEIWKNKKQEHPDSESETESETDKFSLDRDIDSRYESSEKIKGRIKDNRDIDRKDVFQLCQRSDYKTAMKYIKLYGKEDKTALLHRALEEWVSKNEEYNVDSKQEQRAIMRERFFKAFDHHFPQGDDFRYRLIDTLFNLSGVYDTYKEEYPEELKKELIEKLDTPDYKKWVMESSES